MKWSRVGAAVAACVVLGGCGSLHPGDAAVVGDKTVSLSKVDRMVGDYCHAIGDQLKGDAQVIPLNYFRSGIAGSLALRSAADQLAAKYDVTPEQVYAHKVSDLQDATEHVKPEYREAVIEIESTSAYVEGVQAAIGAKLDPDLGYIEAQEKGQAVMNDWIDAHGVEFNPSLGVRLEDGNLSQEDRSVSYAVGETARQGQASTPDHQYAAALPSTQRCG